MPRPHPAPLSGRRPTSLRRLAPVAVLVVALPLVAACGSDEEDTATAAPTVSATTAPPEAPASPQEAAPTPDDALVIGVTVSGEEVTGVEPRTPVPVGARVRLSVTTDATDELHVHGYELTQRIAAGETTIVEFVADRPGIFEVEFHDTKRVLTRLQVQ